jgi:hypothetical protein
MSSLRTEDQVGSRYSAPSSIGWLRAVTAGAPVADDDQVASRPTGVGVGVPAVTSDRRRHHR